MALVTAKQIADKTNLHPNTVRNWADRGIITAKRDFRGRRWFPDPQKTVKRIQGLLNGEIELEQ
jgi:DNA-binding transcriptional MerR regulator